MTRNKIVSGAAAVAAALLGAAGLAGALPDQANPTAGEHVPTTTTTAEVVETEGAETHGKSGENENENDTVETESHEGGNEADPQGDHGGDVVAAVQAADAEGGKGEEVAPVASDGRSTQQGQSDSAGTQAEDAGSQADDHRQDGEHRPSNDE